MTIEFSQVTNMQIDGVDMKDYPKFCDAYVESAEFHNGTPLNDQQLEELNDLDETMSWVNENAYETLLD